MKNEQQNKSNMNEYANYLSLGTEIFLPILLGALVGYYWLDPKFNSKPLWTIIMTLVGFVVGMYTMFKFVRKINSQSKK